MGKFAKPVMARYVRLVVEAWRHHVSMRAALDEGQGCSGLACTKVVNPAYSACKASSIWGGDPIGRSHGTGRLDSSQAWSARHNRKGEWWQMDAGDVKPIVGVRTQGRHGGTDNQRVTAYKVMVSSDGKSWSSVDGGKVFKANVANSHTTVNNKFAKPVMARYVRLVVEAWTHHISMRAALDEDHNCSAKPGE